MNVEFAEESHISLSPGIHEGLLPKFGYPWHAWRNMLDSIQWLLVFMIELVQKNENGNQIMGSVVAEKTVEHCQSATGATVQMPPRLSISRQLPITFVPSFEFQDRFNAYNHLWRLKTFSSTNLNRRQWFWIAVLNCHATWWCKACSGLN
jgi:hypothetical protein